ncbi:MAG: hypothetical protein V9G19_18330 [Tetrasphaera sp.]
MPPSTPTAGSSPPPRRADPVPAVVRALAEAVHGWAVLVDVHGAALQSWPPERAADAARLAPEIDRLRTAGARCGGHLPPRRPRCRRPPGAG